MRPARRAGAAPRPLGARAAGRGARRRCALRPRPFSRISVFCWWMSLVPLDLGHRREVRVAREVVVRAVAQRSECRRARDDAHRGRLGLERDLGRLEVLVAQHQVLADVIADVVGHHVLLEHAQLALDLGREHLADEPAEVAARVVRHVLAQERAQVALGLGGGLVAVGARLRVRQRSAIASSSRRDAGRQLADRRGTSRRGP